MIWGPKPVSTVDGILKWDTQRSMKMLAILVAFVFAVAIALVRFEWR